MAEQADGVLAMIATDRAELIEDFGSELAAHALIAGTDDPAVAGYSCLEFVPIMQVPFGNLHYESTTPSPRTPFPFPGNI